MYVHKLFSVTSVILNKLNLPETQMYNFILANHLLMDYPKDQTILQEATLISLLIYTH
jgi:hypothetical protein